jgi:hypothetical protein
MGFTTAKHKRLKWDTGPTKLGGLFNGVTRRTFTYETYMGYVNRFIQYWSLVWSEVFRKKRRELRYQQYVRRLNGRQAIAQSLIDNSDGGRLKGKIQPRTVKLLWGDGSFQSGGWGYAAVPNVGLYNSICSLSKSHESFSAALVNERYTTKRSACCRAPVHFAKHDSDSQPLNQSKRTVHCVKCKKTINRDSNGACNIANKGIHFAIKKKQEKIQYCTYSNQENKELEQWSEKRKLIAASDIKESNREEQTKRH